LARVLRAAYFCFRPDIPHLDEHARQRRRVCGPGIAAPAAGHLRSSHLLGIRDWHRLDADPLRHHVSFAAGGLWYRTAATDDRQSRRANHFSRGRRLSCRGHRRRRHPAGARPWPRAVRNRGRGTPADILSPWRDSARMADPITIRMGGYGPPTTGFSRALKRIGDLLEAEFGDRVEIKCVWNIMDLGYRAEVILWLVEPGLLTLGYQSSSYLTNRVPELGIVDLPFLFSQLQAARAAMDGALGDVLARKIEERVNFRVLGWFENGFRHISNRLREVRAPAHLAGQRIRVLPSKVQARTFELLGAVPMPMDLTQAIAMITAGSIDAQENPLSNTVTYGVHRFHRFHTLSNHFYVSRPIFLHPTAFD